MTDIEKAHATQIGNIETRTGKSAAQLVAHVRAHGLARHSDIVGMLRSDFGLGHGDANTIAHLARKADETPANASVDPLDALYHGPKSMLRPIHDALLAHLKRLGDFETAPKQKYVSYRRNRQFAMIGPATNTRVDLGLNTKGLPDSPRLEKLPPGKMCNYQVKLTDPAQVDAELVAWIKAAYDAAG